MEEGGAVSLAQIPRAGLVLHRPDIEGEQHPQPHSPGLLWPCGGQP